MSHIDDGTVTNLGGGAYRLTSAGRGYATDY